MGYFRGVRLERFDKEGDWIGDLELSEDNLEPAYGGGPAIAVSIHYSGTTSRLIIPLEQWYEVTEFITEVIARRRRLVKEDSNNGT